MMCLLLIRFEYVHGSPANVDIIIFVDDSLTDVLNVELVQYKKDLDNDGLSYAQANVSIDGLTASSFREMVISIWNQLHMNGCLLVGDFPSAPWEDAHGNYSTDYYYMDLNGTWTDEDKDGRFDTHAGHIRPEIWVSRLMASKISTNKDEIKLFEWYFKKNHQYRSVSSRANPQLPLSTRTRALIYVDNPFAVSIGNESNPDPARSYKAVVNDSISCVEKTYSDVTLVASPLLNATNTNTTNYKYMINSTDGYEFVWLWCHGTKGRDGLMRAYWVNNRWEWHEEDGGIHSSFYLGHSPKTFFYFFASCHSADYDIENSIANSAIFGNGSGLVSIGLTTSSGYWASAFLESFDNLSHHRCIGEAFKTLHNSIIDQYSWYTVYALTLLGDPTIGFNQPPETPSKPSGPELGCNNVEYTYNTSTTDFTEDDLWYQFDWGDGTNSTVGPFSSGANASACHNWTTGGLQYKTSNVTVRARDDYGGWSNWSESLTVTIQMNSSSRYMQNAKWDSTYWKLLCNNTSTYTSQSRIKVGWIPKGYLGVKIYNGTVCISGDDVIEVGSWENGDSGLGSTAWNCSEENVTGTYIKIEIWYKFQGYDWTSMDVVFKTETFTQNTLLNATTWTIYLYGKFQMLWGPLGLGMPNKAFITFYWGSSSRESRIENMIFSY